MDNDDDDDDGLFALETLYVQAVREMDVRYTYQRKIILMLFQLYVG